MIYIIDKNTNRIIHRTEGKYLLDEHTYVVEAPTFNLGEYKLWNYRWVPAKAAFELALKLGPARTVGPRNVAPRQLPKI